MPHPAGMKLRPSISGLFGVVVFATMSVCASAAPISTMTGLARSDTLPVTKVAERQHHGSQAHKARQGRRFYGAAGLDDPPPASDWHDLDSNNLQFGSHQWWEQHPSGRGR
jgi:hypothetical protein